MYRIIRELAMFAYELGNGKSRSTRGEYVYLFETPGIDKILIDNNVITGEVADILLEYSKIENRLLEAGYLKTSDTFIKNHASLWSIRRNVYLVLIREKGLTWLTDFVFEKYVKPEINPNHFMAYQLTDLVSRLCETLSTYCDPNLILPPTKEAIIFTGESALMLRGFIDSTPSIEFIQDDKYFDIGASDPSFRFDLLIGQSIKIRRLSDYRGDKVFRLESGWYTDSIEGLIEAYNALGTTWGNSRAISLEEYLSVPWNSAKEHSGSYYVSRDPFTNDQKFTKLA